MKSILAPLFSIGSLFILLPSVARAADTKPNIILIFADSLGWSDTQLFGTTQLYQTPNLLRLAKRGMLFSRAYAASPLAAPTAASVFNGLNPARTVATPTGQPTTAPTPTTLPTTLKSAGYATAHFGKWHLGPATTHSPQNYGFESDLPTSQTPPLNSLIAPWGLTNFKESSIGEHIDERMTQEAISWMKSHKKTPFFLTLSTFSSSSPLQARPTLVAKYEKLIKSGDPQANATYAAMVETLDTNIGRLLDAVDQIGLAETTAIVFISTNGGNTTETAKNSSPTSNAPLRAGHGTLYEGGTSIPCIISWPNLTKPDSRTDTLIQTTDLFPTILKILSIKPTSTGDLDGTSITPVLSGKPLTRTAIFTYLSQPLSGVIDAHPPAVSVISEDWKLIRFFNGSNKPTYELYQLKEDIGETNDLSDSEPERVKNLDALLTTYLATNKVAPIAPSTPSAGDSTENPTPTGTNKKRTGGLKSSTVGGGSLMPQRINLQLENGTLQITGAKEDSFLGTTYRTTVKLPTPEPISLKMRVRSKGQVTGGFYWFGKAEDGKENASKAEFKLKANEWIEVSEKLVSPFKKGGEVAENLGVIRIYLEAQQKLIEVDWIEIQAGNKPPARWDF